jgi:tetratricopeptide (TPR) repeat protein/DNA-binding CsgD family transcriptional regulator
LFYIYPANTPHLRQVYILFALFILFQSSLHAQYESLLNKKYKDRAAGLNKFIKQCTENGDSVAVLRSITALKQAAEQNKDPELALEADLIRIVYLERRAGTNDAAIVADLNEIINKAKKEGILQIQARAYKLLGSMYWYTFQNYEMAFQTYLLEDKILEQLSAEEFPDKLENTFYIGQAYYEFSDYKQAIHYLKKATRIKPADFNRSFLNSSMNSLGLCYQHLGKLDSSDYYFRQIIASGGGPVWTGIAKGNLGQNQFLRGNYAAAIPLLEADYTEALKNKDSALASGSLMTLAVLAFRQGNTDQATSYTLQALQCVRTSGQYRRYQYLYPLMSKMYAAQGKLQLSFAYLDSAIYAKDSVERKFSSLKLLAAHQKIERQQHEAELEKARQEKQLKIWQRNSLLIFLLLLMTGVLLLFRSQRKRLKQERLIKELEITRMNQELDSAVAQLAEFTRHITEKTQLVEELEQKAGITDHADTTAVLYRSTILTNEQWQHFRALFETVHKGYLKRLQEKVPDLSPAEVRFMTLAKLGFSNKEMAASLGVSPQAIRVTRHRLRKKLNLPEEGNIEELVDSI